MTPRARGLGQAGSMHDITGPPPLLGIHHVRVPSGDVAVARDWYRDVLGFASVLDYEEEDAIVGVVLHHPAGVTLALHLDPGRVEALRGFCILALSLIHI